jgi:hypothetical protein
MSADTISKEATCKIKAQKAVNTLTHNNILTNEGKIILKMLVQSMGLYQ